MEDLCRASESSVRLCLLELQDGFGSLDHGVHFEEGRWKAAKTDLI
jgi:hypothetical protein